MSRSVHILGVRHHSPGCAQLARHRIRATKPSAVLIEGPSDLNGRLAELALNHTLPIAVFSYAKTSQGSHGSWAPLCEYSPEWVAFTEAQRAGALVRFIDLPGWAPTFWQRKNRFSDERFRRQSPGLAELAAKVGMTSFDALWDHLFEQPLDPPELETRLELFFRQLRGNAPPVGMDVEREDFMARCIASTHGEIGEDKEILVVCGGYHSPWLRKTWEQADATWPEPAACDKEVVVKDFGTYLVPYSFHRLDSFAGYESGMPSPAYYQAVWDDGHDKGLGTMLSAVVQRLRKKRQLVSTADLIAAQALTSGLCQLRGHRSPSRIDLLDGLAGALVKVGLEVPLPWNQRGMIEAGTEPILVEILAALSGSREGKLAPETPLPPLFASARAELHRLGLEPGTGCEVRVDLDEELGRKQSKTLHRLEVLCIPGFERIDGPRRPTSGQISEQWRIRKVVEADAALIEAGAYGATLARAASAALEEAMVQAGGRLSKLTDFLTQACFSGLEELSGSVLEEVSTQVGREPSFVEAGGALAELLSLFSYDVLFGAQHHKALGTVLCATYERALWLAEGIAGPRAPADRERIGALVALRDTLAREHGRLNLGHEPAHSVMDRLASDSEATPAMRGGALGFLWSTDGCGSHGQAEQRAFELLAQMALPDTVGDFLTGLVALAREQVLGSEELISALDRLVGAMDEQDFLRALPAMRLAFEALPPADKAALASKVRSLHGEQDQAATSGWLTLDAPAQTLAEAKALEAAVDQVGQKLGLSGLIGHEQEAQGEQEAESEQDAEGEQGAGEQEAESEQAAERATGASAGGDGVHSAGTQAGAGTDPLARWRLVLGDAARAGLPSLDGRFAAMDAALAWLYGRGEGLLRRGVRRSGGQERSTLSVPDWINEVHRLFPRETIERLERDAVERYQIDEVVTNLEVLERVEPNQALLEAVLRTKHLMSPEVLDMARRLVAQVIAELMKKLAKEMTTALSGARNRRKRSFVKYSRNFDAKGTVIKNLKHYDPARGRVLIETPLFFSRSKRHNTPWQIILLVDQSGSMIPSAIHSAVTAACLWGLPAIKTHLVLFDTEVVDLTSEAEDPVEVLMKVQLGGGTDIAHALSYARSLIETPRRAIVVVISDFYEGGSEELLLRHVRDLCEQETIVLGLAALDERAQPDYNRDTARAMVDRGAHVGAMTPGQLAGWIAEKVGQ